MKQVIVMYSKGNRVKTLVFCHASENDALYDALTNYAHKYKNITSVRCTRIIVPCFLVK